MRPDKEHVGGAGRILITGTVAAEVEVVPRPDHVTDKSKTVQAVVIDRFHFQAGADVTSSLLGKTQENQPLHYKGRIADTAGGDTGIMEADIRGEPDEEMRLKVVDVGGTVADWSLYLEFHYE